MSIVSAVSTAPPARAPSFATQSAWLLGHALGLHSEISSPPSGYSSEETDAFRKGWALGARSRRPSLGDPDGPLPVVAQSEADEAAWAALSHGDSHDGLFCPSDIENWALPSHEFYDAEAERDERNQPDLPEEAINWALGRRLTSAMIGGGL